MIVNAKLMLDKAMKEQYAVCQFNINNLEWTRFILEECQDNNSPVILGVSEGATKYMGGYKTVANIVKSLVEELNITVPVCLHLDHGSSYDNCVKAIDSGFTSVMIDASRENFEKNIQITNDVVKYAKEYDVTVEAEIGHIGGEEDGIAMEILYAEVDKCIDFVAETKIDFLAPALGSVHGLYKGEPNLNFSRMEEIKNEVNLPLVLHGGTGIPDYQIKKAIECGICKININTELQIVWTNAVRGFLNENKEIYDPRKIIKAGETAIKKAVKEKIKLLGSNDKA